MNAEKLKELIDVNREALNDPTTTKSKLEYTNLKMLLRDDVPLDIIESALLHPALNVKDRLFLAAFKCITLHPIKDIAEVLGKLVKIGKLNISGEFTTIVIYGLYNHTIATFYNAVIELLLDSTVSLSSQIISEMFACVCTRMIYEDMNALGRERLQKLYTSLFTHPSFSLKDSLTAVLVDRTVVEIVRQINLKTDFSIVVDTLGIRDNYLGMLYSLTHDEIALPPMARDFFIW